MDNFEKKFARSKELIDKWNDESTGITDKELEELRSIFISLTAEIDYMLNDRIKNRSFYGDRR